MTDIPRRPLVPGPTQAHGSGIAAKAVAMREAHARPHSIANDVANDTANREMQRLQGGLTALAPRVPGLIGSLAGAIAEVMANVGTIEKGGFNAYHRYNYARMEDLLQAITPLMGKNGIAVFQNEIEIKTVENRLVISYDFIVAHKSGETMGPMRQSGMCMARNSKGDYDDKAINKCHTQARKYFLLSLFQVPAGDFDDNDGEDANQRRAQQPIPGPKEQVKPQQSTGRAGETVPGPSQPTKALEGVGPRKIVLAQGSGADAWATAYIKTIGQAASEDELKEWDRLNDVSLQHLSKNYPEVYERVGAAVDRRFADLNPATAAPLDPMPDPKIDSQITLNWVAAQLQQFNSYDAAEVFWNTIVAPRESEFEDIEWEMLMHEWTQTEARLATPPEEPTP